MNRYFQYAACLVISMVGAGCGGQQNDDAGTDAAVDVASDAAASVDAVDTVDAAPSDAMSDVPGAPDTSGPCSPQDAMGVGTCPGHLGFAWNGVACVPVDGCSCTGSACGSLPMMESDCQSAHSTCPGIDCRTTGCPSGQSCQACTVPMDQAYTCLPNGSAC